MNKILYAVLLLTAVFCAGEARANTLSELTGSYAYQDGSGGLELTKQGNTLAVSITTANPSGNSCWYEGQCTVQNNKLVCKSEDSIDSEDIITVTVNDSKTLNVSASSESYYCGNNAYFTVTYKK